MKKTLKQQLNNYYRRKAFPASFEAFFSRFRFTTPKQLRKKSKKMGGRSTLLFFISSFLLFPLKRMIFLPAPFPRQLKSINNLFTIGKNKSIPNIKIIIQYKNHLKGA